MPLNFSRIITVNLFLTLLLFFGNTSSASDARHYFKITVVDDATGRGVPLVELKTTNNVRYYTDSNGIVAFYEPDLMDREVFFYVKSHGYEFNERLDEEVGKILKVTGGGSAVLKIKRLNIAERLYRVTGEGIYRDSLLVGHSVPIKHPTLNGQVMGQDTVLCTRYKGKLYWFWGDTIGPAAFNGAASGATSELPGNGGLNPSTGVNLTYFVNESGFSKQMCPIPRPGLVWLEGLMTVTDEKRVERLVAGYARQLGLGDAEERGIVSFNDRTEVFEPLVRFNSHRPHRSAHPFRVTTDSGNYYYFYFNVRVKADLKHVTDPKAYQAFTCLVAGSRYDKAASRLDRSSDGHLIYAWKADTDPVDFDQQQELIAAGKIKPEEALFHLQDIDTGAIVAGDPGSVFWNDFRKRWVMLVERLGQAWYAEGDTPVGPWVYAKKVVTHDRYSFYNITQHPFFDQEGGRLIYFEGTYTDSFANPPDVTPRYNYNQIMYRLALDNPLLFLPAPVYYVKSANGGGARYLLREGVEAQNAWGKVGELGFFALPPTRPREGLIPIYAVPDDKAPLGGIILQRDPPVGKTNQQPLFYALALNDGGKEAPSSVVPLYEYRHGESGARFYSTRPDLENKTNKRADQPICRVWRNPMSSLILDHQTRPVGDVKK